MKRVFITGGTGFFGKSILSSGLFDDMELTLLSRDPEKFRRSFPVADSVHFVRGDIRDFVFPETHFDWIIHGAAEAKPDIPDDQVRSTILDGTKRVLSFARVCNAERLLFISSGAVYGVQDPMLYGIPETHPLSPVTEYGRSKAEAESLCLASGTGTVIARCFAFIGKYLPREHTHFAAGCFLHDVLSDQPVTIRGDGRDYRSYMDAQDLVSALKTLLEKGLPGEICNVGSCHAVSILELAQTILRISGKDLPVRILTTPREGPPPRYVPDTKKLSEKFTPAITLEESIRRILEGK